MKTRTEIILTILKVLALIAGIGFSIQCGSQLLSLVASFINPEWAKNVFAVSKDWFEILPHNKWYFVCMMSNVIFISALKTTTWYLVFDLLVKLKISTPFSIEVQKTLEHISYYLFSIWFLLMIGKSYLSWLPKHIAIPLSGLENGDAYFFIAGIVYIISQIFKRGIEIQEENALTV